MENSVRLSSLKQISYDEFSFSEEAHMFELHRWPTSFKAQQGRQTFWSDLIWQQSFYTKTFKVQKKMMMHKTHLH